MLILTEGSNEIGLGHVYRCQAIAQEVEKRKIQVTFCIPDWNDFFLLNNYEVKKENWYDLNLLKNLLDDYSPSIVLVDSYLATSEVYEYIYEKVPSLLILDDNNDFRYKGGGIINPSYFANIMNYPNPGKSFHYLFGLDYAILRSAFQKEFKREICREITNILVMIGGTDFKNYSPSIVKILNNQFPDAVISIISQKKWSKNNKRLTFYDSLSDYQIADLMKKADLAITGGGSTIYELIATRLPFIAIKIADNQEMNIKMINEIEIGLTIQNVDELLPALKKVEDPIVRKKFSNNQEGYSTEGVKKIVDFGILETLDIQNAMMNDAKDLYSLSTSAEVRSNSLNSSQFSYDSHKIWLEKIIEDPNNILFVLREKKTRKFSGTIRIQKQQENLLISLSFDKRLRGKHISSMLLKEIMKKAINIYNISTFIAEVKDTNTPSKKLFISLGFKEKNSEENIIRYEYQWKEG